MRPMLNKKDIKKIIARVTRKKIGVIFVNPKYKFAALRGYIAYAGTFDDNDTIFINDVVWKECSELYQKCTILHELGHIFCSDIYNPRKLSQAEVDAEIWAINKSHKFGKKFHEYYINYSSMEWGNLGWNSKYRRYRIAYRMLKERKLI
jgi:hypothetical protein